MSLAAQAKANVAPTRAAIPSLVFGSREDGVALYCKEHTRDGGENVKDISKLCHHEGCSAVAPVLLSTARQRISLSSA